MLRDRKLKTPMVARPVPDYAVAPRSGTGCASGITLTAGRRRWLGNNPGAFCGIQRQLAIASRCFFVERSGWAVRDFGGFCYVRNDPEDIHLREQWKILNWDTCQPIVFLRYLPWNFKEVKLFEGLWRIRQYNNIKKFLSLLQQVHFQSFINKYFKWFSRFQRRIWDCNVIICFIFVSISIDV